MGSCIDQSINSAFMEFAHFQASLCRIYDDTVRLIKDEPNLQEEQCSLLNDPQFRNLFDNKLSIVILGESYKAQCECLNWLLGETVIPVTCSAWIKKGCPLTVRYGVKPELALTLSDSFVLPINNGRIGGLELKSSLSDYAEKCDSLEQEDIADCVFMDINVKEINNAGLEILLDKPLLQSNVEVIVQGTINVSCDEPSYFENNGPLEGVLPIFLYSLEREKLTYRDIAILENLKQVHGDCPVLFWLTRSSVNLNLSVCNQHNKQLPTARVQFRVGDEPLLASHRSINSCDQHITYSFQEALTKFSTCKEHINTIHDHGSCFDSGCILSSDENIPSANHCDERCNLLHSHATCETDHSILRRIQNDLENIGFYFNSKCNFSQCGNKNCSSGYFEHDFKEPYYNTSMMLAKPDECSQLPNAVICFINRVAQLHLLKATELLNSYHKTVLDDMIKQVYSLSRDVMITPKRMSYAHQQEKELYNKLLDIAMHKQSEFMDIIASVKREHASAILKMAENYEIEEADNEVTLRMVSDTMSDIQNLVLQQIKYAAADKLSSTINVLKDNMTGTLSRCIECLESSDEHVKMPSDVSDDASTHLHMILNAAYNVDVTIHSSSSLLKLVIDKIRQMLRTFSWKEVPVMDASWKRGVAENVLNNLCENRLAKTMCSQFRSHLRQSHDAFLTALRNLESRHQGRLEREKEKRQHASKVLAPRVAQLALRSRSLIDEVLYGTPKIGRELGRGMYGIVFSCSPWPNPACGGKPCAIKSVVPQDEKHWNDLSLEFYYSMCLPPHPRIVRLFGSIVDQSYGGGLEQPQVFLVMERMQQDLHASIKKGMFDKDRMRVALDVVEGIRFLHSQGLVHRDIKLKNVLLDKRNRAKITDLGFCKPGAMISGSIVGTPIHMPPELFTGQYDNSVDVYAFGILFWHLCAGTTRLPKKYGLCSSKDHLWNAVKKGTRPEYLPCFSTECWMLMKECWDADPNARPLLGVIQTRIHQIIKQNFNSVSS
ncbi:dual serine/threonine and tyrosine protein kinase-like [Clavelina lepadiformis]|uniref:dual serine/threonine and tyrosine protein kinase-like n=1 Tax=Clavelina lepadiformis TaxID=159417 RepID=UPI0040436595